MVEKRIVLIGAGSIQFGLGTMADILLSDVLKGSTIVLHDINAQALEPINKIGNSAIKERDLDFKLESTTSRAEALGGADFIISAIEVGDRFKLWEQDYEIPRKYGNRQTFGENGGPGGLFHSLRIIPPILEICQDVQQICPKAYFINFSNPMSRICLAIKRKFPRLKVVGLCHEIFFLVLHLPHILNTPFANLTDIKAGGLNHFGVLLEIKYKDTRKDAYPEIRAKALKYFEEKGREIDLIKYILKHFHVLPYTVDSHFSEYIHWGWEQANVKDIRDFYIGYKGLCKSEPRRFKRFLKGRLSHKWWLRPSGERVIPIIEGILTDSGQYELSVNLPNTDGMIEEIPRDLVVEGPAIVDKNGLHGVKLKNIPKGIAALWRNQASVQDLVVEAALTKSREIALQALLVDPVVESAASAEKMLNEILNLQKDYIQLS
ncbi:MAG: alpha-glucosidase [Candidatus Helarchaeota archaeon]|nr:alpha-glucosidase [Candidatus Helarchaeota archaeon]